MCKVRPINYRGYNREPFWNCLSVHPIFFNRECVLFAARLQDYSYRLAAGLAAAFAVLQGRRSLPDEGSPSEINSAKRFAQPRIVEVQPSGLDEDGQQQHEHRLRRLIPGGRLLRDEQRRWELG